MKTPIKAPEDIDGLANTLSGMRVKTRMEALRVSAVPPTLPGYSTYENINTYVVSRILAAPPTSPLAIVDIEIKISIWFQWYWRHCQYPQLVKKKYV
jgi:hypothetical protein